ncbi:MAG: hypothetical protein ACR2O3_08480 [Rhizobiaceae bacterium]
MAVYIQMQGMGAASVADDGLVMLPMHGSFAILSLVIRHKEEHMGSIGTTNRSPTHTIRQS